MRHAGPINIRNDLPRTIPRSMPMLAIRHRAATCVCRCCRKDTKKVGCANTSRCERQHSMSVLRGCRGSQCAAVTPVPQRVLSSQSRSAASRAPFHLISFLLCRVLGTGGRPRWPTSRWCCWGPAAPGGAGYPQTARPAPWLSPALMHVCCMLFVVCRSGGYKHMQDVGRRY